MFFTLSLSIFSFIEWTREEAVKMRERERERVIWNPILWVDSANPPHNRFTNSRVSHYDHSFPARVVWRSFSMHRRRWRFVTPTTFTNKCDTHFPTLSVFTPRCNASLFPCRYMSMYFIKQDKQSQFYWCSEIKQLFHLSNIIMFFSCHTF